jgi:hypothetical protein
VWVTPQSGTIEPFTICDREYIQTDPSVIFNGENYIVIWSDARFTNGFNYWIVAARVAPLGTVIDTGYCIGGSGHEYHSDIAFDGDRCLAVWYVDNERRISCRFINDTAHPEGEVITVATISTPYDYDIYPQVDFDGDNYFVVWHDKNGSYHNIYGQFISQNGGLIGEKIEIAVAEIEQRNSDVVFDGNNYFVVWEEYQEPVGIHGQHVTTNGQLIGTNFRISNNTSRTRSCPKVGVSSNNYLVAWAEFPTGGSGDIYGNVDINHSVEEKQRNQIKNNNYGPTIISGQLCLPPDERCNVYDISGRLVKPYDLKPGIYFIKMSNQLKKIVKVK